MSQSTSATMHFQLEELDCSTESNLGTVVSITAGCVYGLILVGVSIYSFRFLMRFNEKFMNASCTKKLTLWFMDVYKRRRCYLPIITHLADMITDFAVVVQFGELAVSGAYCGGINMWYLFSLSIFVLLFYRTISSFLIYQTTKSCSRLIAQWLDFELFRTLYINYLCDKDEPCSPQRWITSLEAAFESTPQALIQTIFLVVTGSFNENPVVLASLVFSLWSIISKIISDDRVIAAPEAKYIALDVKQYQRFTCVSWPFICRYVWRIFDVSSRILIASLIWLIVGGIYLTVVIVIESLVILVIAVRYKRYEFVFGVVAVVVSKSTDLTTRLTNALIIHRSASNLIFMAITTWLMFSNRVNYNDTSSQIFPIFLYCWFMCLATPILSYYLTNYVFTGTKSNARSLEIMIKTGDWKGIVEMQAYKGEYGVYDKANNKDLLMLAVEHNYGKFVSHLSFEKRVQLDGETNDGENLLDFFKKSNQNAPKKASKLNQKYMGELLLKLHEEHPGMVSKDGGENIACIACYLGDADIFGQLQEQYDVSNAWSSAEKADEPKMMEYLMRNSPKYPWPADTENDAKVEEQHSTGLEHVLFPAYIFDSDYIVIARKMIALHNPRSTDYFLSLTSDDAKSAIDSDVWFYAAEHGDVATIKSVRKKVTNVNTTNRDGQTVLHVASNERGPKIVNYLQAVVDGNIRDKEEKLARHYMRRESPSYYLTYYIETENNRGMSHQNMTNFWLKNNQEDADMLAQRLEDTFKGTAARDIVISTYSSMVFKYGIQIKCYQNVYSPVGDQKLFRDEANRVFQKLYDKNGEYWPKVQHVIASHFEPEPLEHMDGETAQWVLEFSLEPPRFLILDTEKYRFGKTVSRYSSSVEMMSAQSVKDQDAKVLVKVIQRSETNQYSSSHSTRNEDLFARERMVLSILNQIPKANVGILPYLGWDDDYATFYIGTERLFGEKIFDRVLSCRVRQSPEKHLLLYIRAMFESVCVVHSKHIAMRNLSLQNFQFGNSDKNNILYLTHYEGARVIENNDEPNYGNLSGKVLFMSPELCGIAQRRLYETKRWEKEISGQMYIASDVWALGIIAYYLATGHHPFYTDAPVPNKLRRTLNNIMISNSSAFDFDHIAPFQLQNTNTLFADWLHRVLCPDYKQRATTQQALEHEFLSLRTTEQLDGSLSTLTYHSIAFKELGLHKAFEDKADYITLLPYGEKEEKEDDASDHDADVKKDEQGGVHREAEGEEAVALQQYFTLNKDDATTVSTSAIQSKKHDSMLSHLL